MTAALRAVQGVTDLVMLPVMFVAATASRLAARRIDVGLGPEPIISHIYLKQALQTAGRSAESYVRNVYHLTHAFDYRGDRVLPGPLRLFLPYWLFVRAIFRYRCLCIYFHGGPLSRCPLLEGLEPTLLAIAGVRVIVMPYGADVQDMARSPNALFKHTMGRDYPAQRLGRTRIARRIDRWTRRADHVISGCEWVDYTYHWDTLMLAHFAIDTDAWPPAEPRPEALDPAQPLRILHAPNHRHIKGTRYFIDAVQSLREEGVPVELVLLERVPNSEVKKAMAEADVVADQLIVGWYAMFAIEGMATGRPVLCYLREDLERLYRTVGLLNEGDPPIVRCDPLTVKERIRALADHRDQLSELGRLGRQFVLDHHSPQVIGRKFSAILETLGI